MKPPQTREGNETGLLPVSLCSFEVANSNRQHAIKKISGTALMVLLIAGSTLSAFARNAAEAAQDLVDLDIGQLVNVEVASVVGASKYEQKVTQAPSSVSIVTADEIKKFGHRTLADVLRSVRGLYVSNDRNYSYLGARGFLRPGDYNTRMLVLVDGHRMNDNIYDGAYFGHENTIDVDLIKRVEIIRGPSSSIYGNSAFFGVINVVTKRGRDLDGAEVSVEGGSFETYKGRFSFGRKFANDVEWLFSGSYYTSAGQDRLYFPEYDQRISLDPRATNNGIARNLDDEEAVNLFTSLNYHDFTFSGMFSHRYKQVPTASFETLFNDPDLETTDYRAYADVKYNHAFNDNVSLSGRLSYDNYAYCGSYPYNYAAPGDPMDRVVSKDGSNGEWVETDWELTARIWERHTLLIGTQYRENLRAHQQYYDDVEPRIYYLDINEPSRSLGLFSQVEAALLTNLVLNAGLRYDHFFETFGSTLNPRMGLIYNPWRATTFKALYGEAFRAPNLYEQSYYSEQQNRPELDPETIRTYELVYEQYLPKNHRFSISGFYYEVDDLITQAITDTGDYYFDNLENATAQGLEFELEGKYESGLLARASYTIQRAEDASTERELTSSPRHLAKLNLAVPIYRDKIYTGLELQYHSETHTLDGAHADPFLIANLTLFSRELVEGLEISATIYNLFDTKYGYPGAEDHSQDVIRQDGRSFRLKLSYRF